METCKGAILRSNMSITFTFSLQVHVYCLSTHSAPFQYLIDPSNALNDVCYTVKCVPLTDAQAHFEANLNEFFYQENTPLCNGR